MTTNLLVAEAELSRQLGDYWASTTTGAGAATSLVDTALMAKANDWITDETWAFLTSEPTGSAAIYDERKASSLSNTDGTLTTLTFAAAPGTGITYEVHRLFSPSEKRRALIYAARTAFPHIHEKIWDESIVSGNWLKDGSFEIWTSATVLSNWTASVSTLTQTTTSPYYKHGLTSCKLSTASGYVYQRITNWDDLKRLAGHEVTFTAQGWCNTASCLRLAIYDGTTTTYSDYHDGDSAWTEDTDPLTVTATIKDHPTQIEFRVYHPSASGVSYVDDARVIGPTTPRLYIGGLSISQNMPHGVSYEQSEYSTSEPWIGIHNYELDTENGYLLLPQGVPENRTLRIRGIGYLDFLASGVSSTAWTATININSPQTDILVAQAALYLYTEMAMPNFTQGARKSYQEMMGFWQQELRTRKAKFGMPIPATRVDWGI